MVNDFVVWMRRRELSEGTVVARRYLLAAWVRWCAEHDLEVFAATDVDVERWLDTVERAASSRYAAVSHLHAFYVWAIKQRLTATDPTVLVERPRLRPRLPRPIHETDLALAFLTASAPAMRVALHLAAGGGLRCCEIARLRWDDVHDARARVLGKGSRERMVPLRAATVEALDELPRTAVWVLDGWQSSVAGHPGLRTSQRINAHLRSVGISATAHQLRHYAGTHALRSCGNLRKVQQLLGHASPATTAMYTALDVDELFDVVEGIPIGVR
jgi:site-specific recombinase XerD